jgi:hypothetical protein
MRKSRPPEGFPNEVEFCKRKFEFHKSNGQNGQRQIYKLDHVLIFIEDDPGEPGPYFDVTVCTTSREHQDLPIAKGSWNTIPQAVKKAEKDFQAMYYKIKPLMER